MREDTYYIRYMENGKDRLYSFHLGTIRDVALGEADFRAENLLRRGATEVTMLRGEKVVMKWYPEYIRE